MSAINILFITSESDPFIKVGGLGDVSYALPKALKKIGVNIKVILPNHGTIKNKFKKEMKFVSSFSVPVGWRDQKASLFYLKYNNIDFYFIDNEYYFKRHIPYGNYDDGEIFSFFSRATLESIKYIPNFKPNILHCNDWHTAIIPVLLKEFYSHLNLYKNIKTIFTIHNLKYQGVFNPTVLQDLLGLNNSYFSEDKLKFYDNISFMKGGLNYSDIITTVSDSYAKEIMYPFFGENLDGLIYHLKDKIFGIINGIDYSLYNPRNDSYISNTYGITNYLEKVKNKTSLQKKLNLPINENVFVIGLVSRLVSQKGLDLIKRVLDEILNLNIQFIILGSGDLQYEDLFSYYSQIYPDKLSANITFSSSLAKEIYAGCDLFLMPSLFEPCGIGQLIAMRYGTVPLVRSVGGLKDTVFPFDKTTKKGNGFTFHSYNAHDMLSSIENAYNLYYTDKKSWNILIKSCMRFNCNWNESAKKYKSLYSSLI
ncbi:glycogen synthase GlgA [uncultured Cetobacterium sp.]|uniref:glycogen synthase GlgA n=1 Tax=uncultured Cetobacterium sp. TaxID=527638 RepID=UPI002609C5D5|nr:glycogen synthase GlgA [uncultured Cetobacterium sp.]